MPQDTPSPIATYADLEAVPPHLVAEIICGRLVTRARSRPRQLDTASVLGGLLLGPFRLGRGGPGSWWIIDEPELHLSADVAVPDLAGWRRERMPSLPKTAWFDLAPDWLCEVISPSTEAYDRGEKRDIYAAHGVRHLWLIDPDQRLLETFEFHQGKWLLLATYRDAAEVAAPPFEAAPFALDLLWAD